MLEAVPGVRPVAWLIQGRGPGDLLRDASQRGRDEARSSFAPRTHAVPQSFGHGEPFGLRQPPNIHGENNSMFCIRLRRNGASQRRVLRLKSKG
jgi:hypothetical protein